MRLSETTEKKLPKAGHSSGKSVVFFAYGNIQTHNFYNRYLRNSKNRFSNSWILGTFVASLVNSRFLESVNFRQRQKDELHFEQFL